MTKLLTLTTTQKFPSLFNLGQVGVDKVARLIKVDGFLMLADRLVDQFENVLVGLDVHVPLEEGGEQPEQSRKQEDDHHGGMGHQFEELTQAGHEAQELLVRVLKDFAGAHSPQCVHNGKVEVATGVYRLLKIKTKKIY